VLYHVIDTLRHVLRAWFVEAYHQVGHQLDQEQGSELIRWHRTLYEAIRARDAGEARRAMARHVEGGARWLRDAMQRTGRSSPKAE
jgi:DNA-binding FadR family transcriptional regulator